MNEEQAGLPVIMWHGFFVYETLTGVIRNVNLNPSMGGKIMTYITIGERINNE
jgi:hypothetical protein